MTQNLELYRTTCQVGITASSIAVGIVVSHQALSERLRRATSSFVESTLIVGDETDDA